MSYATYLHLGDPSGTPSADVRFAAAASGAAGNDITIEISTTLVSGDVGITVTGSAIEVVSLRTGGDADNADATTLADFVTAFNADASASALAVATLVNTATGATLWSTGGSPQSLSGGADTNEDVEITMAPEITLEITNTGIAFGSEIPLAPDISMEITPEVTASRTVELIPDIAVSVDFHTAYAAQVEIVPDISTNLSFEVLKQGLTICDVVRDILMQWGLEIPCAAPQFAKIAAVNTLNQSMQSVWNQAKDRNYWTRQTVSVTYPKDAVSYNLSDSVQNIVGHVRLDGRPLTPLGSKYEAEHFDELFGEDTTNPPTAYYADRLNQAGGEPCKVTLMLVPPPAEQKTVSVDAVMECPRYTVLDLDSCPLVPIPHKYVESLLMPVARYLSMQTHLFINEANREAIIDGYQAALGAMDAADPLVAPARQQKGGDQ